MFGVFRSIKRVMTGTVIHRMDIATKSGRSYSFRLKEAKDRTRYVVLAAKGSGEIYYNDFEAEEFAAFCKSANVICEMLESKKPG